MISLEWAHHSAETGKLQKHRVTCLLTHKQSLAECRSSCRGPIHQRAAKFVIYSCYSWSSDTVRRDQRLVIIIGTSMNLGAGSKREVATRTQVWHGLWAEQKRILSSPDFLQEKKKSEEVNPIYCNRNKPEPIFSSFILLIISSLLRFMLGVLHRFCKCGSNSLIKVPKRLWGGFVFCYCFKLLFIISFMPRQTSSHWSWPISVINKWGEQCVAASVCAEHTRLNVSEKSCLLTSLEPRELHIALWLCIEMIKQI